jgi:hypothetical protein
VAHIVEHHHDKEAELVRETARRANALGEAAFYKERRSTLEALDVVGLLVGELLAQQPRVAVHSRTIACLEPTAGLPAWRRVMLLVATHKSNDTSNDPHSRVVVASITCKSWPSCALCGYTYCRRSVHH